MHRFQLRPVPAIAGLAVLLGTALASCKSSPEVNPYEAAGDSKSDLLDEEVEGDEQAARANREWDDRIDMNVADPPDSLSHTIDGKADDWSNGDFRDFDGRDHLTDGEQFWDGSSDTSVSVAADSDPGHLYFSIDVEDDTVIEAGSEEPFVDGVVLELRDPKLAELRDELPDSVVDGADLYSDMSIIFTPDGQFWNYEGNQDQSDGPVDKARNLYRKGIRAATIRTDRGYRVEVAVKLGTIRQVARIPLPDVAFRVNVIDGDDRSRRGDQTHFNTLPPLDDGSERFALLDLDGWLPYASLDRTPPREGALGRWKITSNGWVFDAFEVPPERRRRLPETDELGELLDDSPFEEVCDDARRTRKVLSAWETKGHTHRSGLVACGTRPTDDACPEDARTNLYHVRFSSSPDGWKYKRSTRLTPEPLEQCPASAPPGETRYEKFSFLPLSMVGSPIWAVGWKEVGSEGGDRYRRSGVWFVHTDTPQNEKGSARIGAAQLSKTEADSRSREHSTSRVYLAEVDRKQGLDVCEIETIRQQNCRGLNRRCSTPQRGVEKIAHIQMWQPSEERFERYTLSKHRNCQAGFDFAARDDAYLLLQRGGRLGVVRTPDASDETAEN